MVYAAYSFLTHTDTGEKVKRDFCNYVKHKTEHTVKYCTNYTAGKVISGTKELSDLVKEKYKD